GISTAQPGAVPVPVPAVALHTRRPPHDSKPYFPSPRAAPIHPARLLFRRLTSLFPVVPALFAHLTGLLFAQLAGEGRCVVAVADLISQSQLDAGPATDAIPNLAKLR
ncbi:unnamed protein product, partial [Urochloa humidicola]